jgi:acetoacetyl-CoA synthetase
VIDRLAQLEPTVLLAVGGYGFRDRSIDRRDELATIRAALPSLRHVVHVPYGEHEVPDALSWGDLLSELRPLAFLPVAFDHPLFVLFSSGTTGRPKAIVHGHGGILLENLKAHAFSWDLKPGGRLLWFSTTSWMMWNALVSALLVRSSIVMLDGDPSWPDIGWQWRLAEETRPTFMGVSPAFLMACRKAGLAIGREHDLRSIRAFGTAGSPLPAEGYRFVYEQLGSDVLLINGSGGTDVCSGIVGGSPLLPVFEGEISGRLLGVATDAFDQHGEPLVGELGELVITRPMPSMPVGLWGDTDGSLYRSSYFDMFPGIWRQGDWIRFSERGSCVVTGRSDATLNRGGVRLGTSEFYSVVEELPEVSDSLVVHLEDDQGGPGELVLFVMLADGFVLDEELRAAIGRRLRSELSPRHAPDTIRAVPAIPRTLTGKKLEAPVKRILRGEPVDAVASRDSLLDPTALDMFADMAVGKRPLPGVGRG